MKKVLILLAAICCCGCGSSIEKEIAKTTEPAKIRYYCDDIVFIYSIEVEGHLYIVFDGYHEGGIIHAEHCPCKTK